MHADIRHVSTPRPTYPMIPELFRLANVQIRNPAASKTLKICRLSSVSVSPGVILLSLSYCSLISAVGKANN